MSAITYPPPVTARQTPFHQYGESSSAHTQRGVTRNEAQVPTNPRMVKQGTMSSTSPSGNPQTLHHAADFRGRGISWSIICLALCTVIGMAIVAYYTNNFVFGLVSATILRAVGLCAVMVPTLFRGKTFRLQRRRTFALLCLLSLLSVVAAWVLWHIHDHDQKWPRVLLTVADIFSVVAGVQLVISEAYEQPVTHEDEMDTTGVWIDLDAQDNQLRRE